MTKILLASASPRRRDLIKYLGYVFECVSPDCEEISAAASPRKRARELACLKARAAAKDVPADVIVVGADTLVSVDREILGKPKTKDQAVEMLKKLSGKAHRVYTGMCVIKGDRELSACEETVVYFRRLTNAEIRAYVDSGEPMDKAGAYGIQGAGALFVSRIEGDFYNVMGLPVCRLSKMVQRI